MTKKEGIKDKIITQLENNKVMKKIKENMSYNETKFSIAFIMTSLALLKLKDNGVIMSSLIDLGIRVVTSTGLYYYVNDIKSSGSAMTNLVGSFAVVYLGGYGLGTAKKLSSCYREFGENYENMAVCSGKPTELSKWHDPNYDWTGQGCTMPNFEWHQQGWTDYPTIKTDIGFLGKGNCYQEVGKAIYDYGINQTVRVVETMFDTFGPQISGVVGAYMTIIALSNLTGSFLELLEEKKRHEKIIMEPNQPSPGGIEPDRSTGTLDYSRYNYEIKDLIDPSNPPDSKTTLGGILGKAYRIQKTLNEDNNRLLENIAQREEYRKNLIKDVANLRLKEQANKIAEKQAEAQIISAEAAVKQADAAQEGNKIGEKANLIREQGLELQKQQIEVDKLRAQDKEDAEQIIYNSSMIDTNGAYISAFELYDEDEETDEYETDDEEEDEDYKNYFKNIIMEMARDYSKGKWAEKIKENYLDNAEEVSESDAEEVDEQSDLPELEWNDPDTLTVDRIEGGKNVKQNRVSKSKNKKCKRKPCRKTKRKNSKHKPRYKTLRNNRKRKPIRKTKRKH